MRISSILLVVLGLAAPAGAAAPRAENFKYQAAVEPAVKAGGVYRLDLPSEVLRNCAPGQPDIRLFSAEGTEVPYSLVRAEYLKKGNETFNAQITVYAESLNEVKLEFWFSGRFSPVNFIDLQIPGRDFRKQAELSASEDGKAWAPLASGEIYDFSSQVDLRRTRLEFKSSTARYYRLVLKDKEGAAPQGRELTVKYDGLDLRLAGGKGGKLRINGVTAGTGGSDSVVGAYDEDALAPERAGTGKDNSSYFYLRGGLPFEKVAFEVEDPFFVRDVTLWYSETGEEDSYRPLGSANIFRFPAGWPDGERTTAAISSPGYGYYKVTVANRNSPPLRVKAVRLIRLKRSLYFIAPADLPGLRLAYGRPGTAAPSYDVSSFINQGNWERRGAQELRLGPLAETAGYSAEAAPDKKARGEKNLLTGVIVLVAAGMGWWLYSLLKKATAKPA